MTNCEYEKLLVVCSNYKKMFPHNITDTSWHAYSLNTELALVSVNNFTVPKCKLRFRDSENFKELELITVKHKTPIEGL